MVITELSLDHRVDSALRESPYLSSRNLRFETEQGRVVLHGEVSSFYQKQMAQEILRGLKGVHQIDNRLQVNWTQPVVASA